MKRIAYHRIRYCDGRIQEGPLVIVFDHCGKPLSWEMLKGEPCGTIWQGGTYEASSTF